MGVTEMNSKTNKKGEKIIGFFCLQVQEKTTIIRHL
jgi:hypothetical protein